MSYEEEFSLDDIFSKIENKEHEKKIERIPFKFLDSYTKKDADIFFGREEEIDDIFRKFYLSKILLVYGRSGTGKSSIISCGLLNKINQEDIYPITIRCGKDAYQDFFKSIRSTRRKLVLRNEIKNKRQASENKIDIENKSGKELNSVDLLKEIYEYTSKPILLIFDQFEEIFILSNQENRQKLAENIKNIYKSQLRVNFIFVIREEYLANFTEMESIIPQLFQNRIRIERLHHSKAKQVIEQPCKICNIKIEDTISQQIIERLTDEKGTLELTYLQIIMDYLYKKAVADQTIQIEIKQKHFDEIKSIGNVLTQFLDEQLVNMKDTEKGELVLKKMISSNGTKRRMSFEEIYEDLQITENNFDKKTLHEIIQYFVNVRIITDKDENQTYELRHDSIAAHIYERMTAFEKEITEVKKFVETAFYNYQKRNKYLDIKDLQYISVYESKLYLKPELKTFIAESKKQISKIKHRQQTIFVAITGIVFIIMAIFTIWALTERNKATNSYENYLKKEADLNKTKYEKYLVLADNYIKEKKIDQAIEEYKHALEFVSQDTVLSFEANKRIETAENIKNDSKQYFIFYNKADSLYNLGENFYLQAIEYFEKAKQTKFDTVSTQTKINEINLKITETTEINNIVNTYITKAKNLMEVGIYDTPRKYLQKAKQLDPNNKEIDELLSKCN